MAENFFKEDTVDQTRITSVQFKNFKAFSNYSLTLKHMNVMVGPNNSGKSTILGAFRALAAGLRRARSKSPEMLRGPDGTNRYGYNISPESLPISIENVHTDYSEADTSVTFRISNGKKLLLHFPKDGGCRMFAQTQNRPPSTPTAFRDIFPITIGVVPVLGPVENDENILEKQTVQRDLSTHRASRHFRNYWYQNPDDFDEFAKLVSKTWRGMEIRAVEPNMSTGRLRMFCEENRISRELYWVGSGFQIWCQILTHLFRAKSDTVLVIDEPEIYLHPDVQRKLVNLIREIGPDILLATHSTEIIGEAEPNDIVLIERLQQSGERLRNQDSSQAAFDHLGSAQNVVHSQIARKRRVVFVEGEDLRYLRWFAKRAGLHRLADGSEIESIELGGFSAWTTVKHRCQGIMEALNKKVAFCCVFDRDYRCNEEIAELIRSLSEGLDFVHVHSRKEIENYFLIPSAMQRALQAIMVERHVREGTPIPTLPDIESMLDVVSRPLKHQIAGQLAAKRQQFFRSNRSPLDDATINEETLALVDQKWSNLQTRLELLPAKQILSELNTNLQAKYGLTLSIRAIADAISTTELPKDLVELLQRLDEFARQKF